MEAELSETRILKPGQIKPRLMRLFFQKVGELTLETDKQTDSELHREYSSVQKCMRTRVQVIG